VNAVVISLDNAVPDEAWLLMLIPLMYFTVDTVIVDIAIAVSFEIAVVKDTAFIAAVVAIVVFVEFEGDSKKIVTKSNPHEN